MNTEQIHFREITTISDLEKVQKLEQNIWGMSPVPIHQTRTAIKNGGVMVGAFLNNELVGYSYGFAGFKNGASYLVSHQLGIAPQLQSNGIGESLKRLQREIAITRGYEKMIWTFDPLETRNGYLNLTKLHGISDTYVENCYGEMKDGLNNGLPSDRFEVTWLLKSPYVDVKHNIDLSNAPMIVNYQLNDCQFPVLQELHPDHRLNEDVYLLPVPSNFQKLKGHAPELAMEWRMKTRKIIQYLFANDFIVVQLEKGKQEVHFYVFVKRKQLFL